jgi:uncharacterized protein
MPNKKTLQFLAISYGISWLTALGIYFTGIRPGSPAYSIIVVITYMYAPAIATIILQKFVYKESLDNYNFRLQRVSGKWLLLTPAVFIAYLLGIVGVIGLLGNGLNIPAFGYLDFSPEGFSSRLQEIVAALGQELPANLDLPPVPVFLLILTVQAIIAGFTINLLAAYGEELGWRGLLLRETQHWGFWKSNTFIGIVWGFWHAPIILMGHNYPGYPVTGVFMMVAFTLSLSYLLAYIRLKTRTVLGAAAFHGMINASGNLALFIASANVLAGSVAGLAGIITGILLTLAIPLWDPKFIRHYSDLS